MTNQIPLPSRSRPRRDPRRRRAARQIVERYDEAKQHAIFRRIVEREAQREKTRLDVEKMLDDAATSVAAVEALAEPKPWWRFW